MTSMSENQIVVDAQIADVLGFTTVNYPVLTDDIVVDYWLDTLAGVAQSHCLPTDKVRQVKHKCDRTVFEYSLAPAISRALNALCKQQGTSRFSLLQSLFALLVGRYSNTNDIVMGAKVSLFYVHEQQQKNVVANHFILRNNIADNPSFSHFIESNQTIINNAFAHRDVDFSQLIKSLQISRHGGDPWVYQLKFHYQQHLSADSSQLFGSSFSECAIHQASNEQPKLDLELNAISVDDDLKLRWFYNANLFNQSTIIEFNQSFNTLIEGVLNNWDKSVYQLPLLTEQQIKALLVDDDMVVNEPSLSCVDQLFEAQVNKTPTNIAIRFEQQQISYQALNQQANQIARALIEQGVEHNTLVGLCLNRTPLLVATILAIFKVQAVYIPFEPSLPKSRLKLMLDDAKVALLLSEQALSQMMADVNTSTILLDDVLTEQSYSDENLKLDWISRENTSPAYVLYTSGSTGHPKGVIGTHGSLTNRLNWMQRCYSATENEVFCVRTTISFVDHIAELFQPLICGASMALLTQPQAIDATLLARQIDRYQINRLTVVPSLLQLLLESKRPESLNSLSLVLSSGEPLKFSLTELFHQTFAKQARLLNLYGSTEVGADVTCYESSEEQQNYILRYFDKPDDKPLEDADNVDGIFAQLQDLSATDGEQSFTQPNVALSQLIERFKETEIPTNSMKLGQYLELLREDLLPYIIDVSSQKYIGHMTSALPNFIPQFSRLIAKYNQNTVKIETSKSMTLMERQVLAMIHRLFYDCPVSDYEQSIEDPMNLHGIITSGGSLANITSLFCARNKGLIAQGVTPEQLRDDGASAVMHSLGYKDAVILVSRLAHYSIKKAAALLGIGLNGLIIIEQDENQRVKTDVLAQVIAQCGAQKRFIIAIIGIAGATETGTIDPLVDMANIAQSHNIHFHVDAAWGGAFMFSDMYKHKLLGIERADSITFCAHKQLYLAQGISLCVFKDPKSIFAITTHADYQAAAGSYDLGQFTIEGSRPASSLLLHASLHLLAKDGYGWLIQRGMQRTAYFRQLVQSCDAFELVGDNDLNIINYRYIPFEIRNTNERYCEQYSNSQNQQISAAVDAIQQRQFDEGKTFVSQTKIVHKSYSENKITVFRVVLSNPKTSPEDLFEVLQDQLRIASRYIENQPNQLLLSTQAADIAIAQSGRYTTSIGKPIDKVKLYILDQQMNLVPNGVIGEIYIAGQCLSAGYLNDSKLTEQCFINNPFATGLLYKSGDLARRMRDGNIEFSGRLDQQINIDGLRVELSEIELILNQSKWVRQAVVLAPHDFNQKQQLVAFIVVKSVVNSVPLSDNKPAVLETIRRELAKRLPDYMMPASFQVIESMPLTANGKVDFKQLLWPVQ